MANYVFKQFCTELDASSLDHLIEIVNKPTEDADVLEEDSESDIDDSDDSDEEAELMEAADDDEDEDDGSLE